MTYISFRKWLWTLLIFLRIAFSVCLSFSVTKYSNKSIKEIAAELDFPNPSFFGKYVKARLGLSPANYRNQILNK